MQLVYSHWRWIAAVIVLALVTALIAQVTFIGADYDIYYLTGRLWLDEGGNLYGYNYRGTDGAFYNAPWLLFLLLPFAALPIQWGQALWHVATLVCLLGVVHVYTRPKLSPILLVLSTVNLFTVDMVIRGQIDAFILAGVVLGWWAIRNERPLWTGVALTILAIKPPNLIFVGLLFLLAMRHWHWQTWAKVMAVPIVTTLITTAYVGLQWPLDYLNNYLTRPLVDYLEISLWRGLELANVPNWPFVIVAIVAVAMFLRVAWRDGVTRRTLSLAIATNLVFTTYANGNHYVMLIPAFIYVYLRDWRYGLVVYALSWTPFLRAFYGYEAAVFDLGYAALLLLGVWFLPLSAKEDANVSAEAVPDKPIVSSN